MSQKKRSDMTKTTTTKPDAAGNEGFYHASRAALPPADRSESVFLTKRGARQ